MISRYPCSPSNAAPKRIGPIAEPTTFRAAVTPRIPPKYRLPKRFGFSLSHESETAGSGLHVHHPETTPAHRPLARIAHRPVPKSLFGTGRIELL